MKSNFQDGESVTQLKRYSKAFVLGGKRRFARVQRVRADSQAYRRVGLERVYLLCEELADVGEGFELEGVAGGIEEEHGCLFANLTLEADAGLDDKGDAGAAKAFG